MANNSIKIKASITNKLCTVKALIEHVMETGLREDKKGNPIPAHFIKEVTCKHNGDLVFIANWSIAVAKNPYLSFNIKNANPGDSIELSWLDNINDSDTITTTVS